MFVTHLVNLLVRSAILVPSRIGSNWGGVIFSLVLFAITEVALWKWGDVKGRWRSVLIGLGVVTVGWLGLFACSVVLTNYDDHKNLSGAAARIKRDVAKQRDELAARLRFSEGQVQILQGRVTDQQGTINSALLQLGKMQSQEIQPLHVISHEISNMLPQTPLAGFKFALVYLVMTNKTITPIRLLATCENDIIATGEVLGTATLTTGGWGGRVTRNNHQYGVGILSPAWSPSNPIVIVVYSNTPRFGICSFDEQ